MQYMYTLVEESTAVLCFHSYIISTTVGPLLLYRLRVYTEYMAQREGEQRKRNDE